jgi:hypothetical protein
MPIALSGLIRCTKKAVVSSFKNSYLVLMKCSSRCCENRSSGYIYASLCVWLVMAGCERLPTEPAQSNPAQIHGMTFADWTANGYSRASADRALDAIAAAGATHLAIIVTAYQANPRAHEIRLANARTSARTPTATAVQHAVNHAKSLGLRVVIKPHVDLDDGTWRGNIAPSDPNAWFKSYRDFILPWAELATTVGAVQFIIGTELAGTIQHEQLWRETIKQTRAIFPGEIVYAASWDEAFKVPFWRELDFAGVDFYFPVATRHDPGRFEILAGWQPWLDRLRLLHQQAGRQIILTEIGYRSVDGAGMRPYEFGDEAALDLQEQADLYWAALQATADESWIVGLFWWNWLANGAGGENNTDYTPSGKPAEMELQKSWRGR